MGLTLAAFGLRQVLGVSFGQRPLLILFVLPIIVSAYLGGLGPGLLSTALAGLGTLYFFVPPIHSLAIASNADLIQWLMLLLSGALISVLSQALRRERARAEGGRLLQEAVLASLDDGVLSADLAGRVTFMNQAAQTLTGWSAAEALGQPLGQVLCLLEESSGRQMADPTGPELGEECLLLPRGGQALPVTRRLAALRAADGQAWGVALILRDCRESRRAAMAQRQQQATLQSFYDSAPLMMGVVELEDRRIHIVTANQAVAEQYGATPESLAGQRLDQLGVPEELHLLWARRYEEARRAGAPVRFEYLRHDGQGSNWLAATVAYVGLGPQGRPRFCYVCEDITARRQIEEALRQSEDKYRHLFENAQVGLFRTRVSDGKPLEVNRRYAALAGYDSVGECLDDFVASEHYRDPAVRVRVVEQLREHGEIQGQEAEIVRRDGSSIWISFSARLDRERGLIEGALVDITARKQAEAALDETRELYRLISEHSGDVIWLYEVATDRLVYISPSVRKLRGLEPEEALGQSMEQALTPESYARVRDGLPGRLAALAAGDESARTRVAEVDQYRKDGSVVPTEVVTTMVQDEQGQVVSIIGVSRDITERKRTEDRLRWLAQFPGQNPNPVLRLNLQGALLYANPPAQGLLASLHVPADATLPQAWLLAAAQAKLAGQPHLREESLADQDFALVFTPVGGDEVTVYGIEITELRRAERGLHLAQEAAQAGAWEWDIVTNRNLWSRELWPLYGLEPESCEPSYESFMAAILPEDRERVAQAVNQAASAGAELEAEWRVNLPLGQVRWLMSRGRPERDGQGKVLRYRGVVMDITRRKLAEQALKESLAEKEALLKEVHHRVKNNLQIVASLLNLQAGKSRSQKVIEALRDTRNRVHSMALLHETLYRSQNLASINFAIYAAELCRHLQRTYGEAAARVALDMRIAPLGLGLDQAVPCGLIISELVSNAYKHAFAGGKPGSLVVSLEAGEEDLLRLSVCDDGAGLPGDMDVERAQTLGLKLVANLARQLGGHLRAQGRPEGGACFSVSFTAGRQTPG